MEEKEEEKNWVKEARELIKVVEAKRDSERSWIRYERLDGALRGVRLDMERGFNLKAVYELKKCLEAWIESENRRILHEVRGDILNFC